MTTTTAFLNPTILTNVNIPNTVTGISSIDWNFNPTALVPGAYASSKKPLYTISGLWMEKFLSNTSELYCTGYADYSQLLRNIRDQVLQISLGDTTGSLYSFLTTIDPVSGYAYGNINKSPSMNSRLGMTAADAREWLLLSNGDVTDTFSFNWWIDTVYPAYRALNPLTRKVTSLDLAIDIQRAGRIQDLKIKLVLNNAEINGGNDLASTINPVQSDMYTGSLLEPLHPVENYNIYGGDSTVWGVQLTEELVSNPTFGVVVSFQSNAIYPHRDTVYLSQASLRITYA